MAGSWGGGRGTRSDAPPAGRSGRRRLVLAAVLAAVVLAGGAVWRLVSVAGDLREAEAMLDDASTSLAEGRMAEARQDLRRAEALVLTANDRLQAAPELDLIGWVPGVRQNLASLEASIALAATVIHGGDRILEASSPLESEDGTLEVSLSAGSISIDAVGHAQLEIARLSEQLPAGLSASEPSPLLLPPTRRLRDEVQDEASARRQQLEVLGRGLRLLHEMAGGAGPRRYLIAVANTAEMRGSGGMILNYGVLEGQDGTIDLTEFGRIDELALASPVSPDLVPADYVARWSGFEPLSRWRQANLAADFTVTAPVLEAMYTAATRLPVNGVIQVDPAGLAAILAGVGPVSVPELGEVRGDNVVALTLNEAYIRFPNVEDRSDVLGDVAEAAFRRLVDGDYPSVRPLADALVGALDANHIVMHATTPAIEESLTAFGADGAYPDVEQADAIGLTVQNLSGNKLDYYLDSSLELRGALSDTEVGEVDATVRLSNTAPAGVAQPQYVFGPGLTVEPLAAGVARSLVTVYLPFGTSLEGASGADLVEPATSGTEAGRPYASFTVDVPADQVREVVLQLRFAPRPSADRPLLLMPSPRVRPPTVTLDLASPAGVLQAEVELDRRWAVLPGSTAVAVVAPAFSAP